MKQLTCEMCGSTDMLKENGMFVCQTCGTKYSVEDAKKMMVESSVDVSGSTVKIDTSSELENLYVLARRAKEDNNIENAQNYYGQILVKDPSSWEAYFYSTYYQSLGCKIGEIGMASIRISNCEDTVFNLIKDTVTDPEEQRKAVAEVAYKLIVASGLLFDAYRNFFIELDFSVRDDQEYANNCSAARDIVYNCGNLIIAIFGDAYGDIAAECWKKGVKQHNVLKSVYKNKLIHDNIIEQYNIKISKYDPSCKVTHTNDRQESTTDRQESTTDSISYSAAPSRFQSILSLAFGSIASFIMMLVLSTYNYNGVDAGGFFLALVCGIAAIPFGIVGLVKSIRSNCEGKSRTVMSAIGLGLGLLSLLACLILVDHV